MSAQTSWKPSFLKFQKTLSKQFPQFHTVQTNYLPRNCWARNECDHRSIPGCLLRDSHHDLAIVRFISSSPSSYICFSRSISPSLGSFFSSTFGVFLHQASVLHNTLKKRGKNVDLYSAYRVLHTSNALSSLN